MLNKGLTSEELDEIRGIAEITDAEERAKVIAAWKEKTGKKFPRFIYGANLDVMSGDRDRRMGQQVWDSTINERKR